MPTTSPARIFEAHSTSSERSPPAVLPDEASPDLVVFLAFSLFVVLLLNAGIAYFGFEPALELMNTFAG